MAKVQKETIEETKETQATATPAENAEAPKQPETIEIVLVGKDSTKTTFLANIIKNCLERDYNFRSYFEGMNVQLRQLVEPVFETEK